jgi:heme A synthase
MGAHAATLLALLAAVVAIVKLRARRPLVVGSVVLALLLLLESFLGGLIRDERADTLTAVHVPLAMAIMAVTVWLSLKAVQLRRRRT